MDVDSRDSESLGILFIPFNLKERERERGDSLGSRKALDKIPRVHYWSVGRQMMIVSQWENARVIYIAHATRGGAITSKSIDFYCVIGFERLGSFVPFLLPPFFLPFFSFFFFFSYFFSSQGCQRAQEASLSISCSSSIRISAPSALMGEGGKAKEWREKNVTIDNICKRNAFTPFTWHVWHYFSPSLLDTQRANDEDIASG